MPDTEATCGRLGGAVRLGVGVGVEVGAAVALGDGVAEPVLAPPTAAMVDRSRFGEYETAEACTVPVPPTPGLIGSIWNCSWIAVRGTLSVTVATFTPSW